MVANTSDSTALDARLSQITQAPVQDSVDLSGRATDSPSPRWALLGAPILAGIKAIQKQLENLLGKSVAPAPSLSM